MMQNKHCNMIFYDQPEFLRQENRNQPILPMPEDNFYLQPSDNMSAPMPYLRFCNGRNLFYNRRMMNRDQPPSDSTFWPFPDQPLLPDLPHKCIRVFSGHQRNHPEQDSGSIPLRS